MQLLLNATHMELGSITSVIVIFVGWTSDCSTHGGLASMRVNLSGPCKADTAVCLVRAVLSILLVGNAHRCTLFIWSLLYHFTLRRQLVLLWLKILCITWMPNCNL